MTETIESIEGVESADFDAEPWKTDGEGGLGSSSGMDLRLTVVIEDGYRINDASALLQYLSECAWFINDDYPKGSVSLEISGGIDPDHDWSSEASSVYGSVRQRYPYAGLAAGGTISLSAEDYGRLYGRWPLADLETPPNAMIERGEPTEELPLATTALQLSWYDAGDNHITVMGERSVTESGQRYEGAVTITWIKDGKKTDKTIAQFDPEFPEVLRSEINVGQDKDRDDHYEVLLEFEPQEGFDTSTIRIR